MIHRAAPLLISACLMGIACRYDGASRSTPDVRDFLHRRHLLPVPICPEQLGGLPTPRTPCQFCGGDGADLWQGTATLVNGNGCDLTPFFQRGAREALKIAQLCGCKAALLACTELPLLREVGLFDSAIYVDPMEIMADRAIDFFRASGEIL
ncbi:MAG: DUF523 domain-containing protein [Deltaproteobacteria bacterium]|nr:DUF523 domain-containing protein [Deltaproteobacteria bacterium]